jgi:hypothetical protein
MNTDKAYNIQIIKFSNGKIYITCRTDSRDQSQIEACAEHGRWYKENGRSVSPVLETLMDPTVGVVEISNPPHLQGITEKAGKLAKQNIVSGLATMLGDDMVLNATSKRHLKVA